jgi:hypothetical protein
MFQNVDLLCVAGLIVGIIGIIYAVISDVKCRSQREWVHMALVNLKPSIRGDNEVRVVAAINNMMEFLKPPPPTGTAKSSTPAD